MNQEEMIKELENVADYINAALNKLNLVLGTEIWMVHNACYECPGMDKDEDCFATCKRKNKTYLEKSSIQSVNILVGDGRLPTYKFMDVDDKCFCISDIGSTVFTNREEALKRL